jgi:two-component system chemotaxis response regulator CheB
VTHILIAEDDSLLRQMLDAALRPYFPKLTLVNNGLDALTEARKGGVDVLVTDWLMPGIDGIELIRRVRAECRPAPFIIMSTVLGSKEAREHALRSGADDFLAKPSRPSAIRECIELATQRHASSQRIPRVRPVRPAPAAAPASQAYPLVTIAASTGGPAALHLLFDDPLVPRDCAYLVALHGPEWMFQSMVDALRRSCSLKVELAEDGQVARPGAVYFACKQRHLLVDAALRMHFDDSPPEHFLRPAADPLFRSAARALGRNAIAVVMTGMGTDGLAGAAEIASAGGTILVQDPSTAVVGGMPGAVIEAGLASEVAPLHLLARSLARHVTVWRKAGAASTSAEQLT